MNIFEKTHPRSGIGTDIDLANLRASLCPSPGASCMFRQCQLTAGDVK
jgi:hypothetical protein